MPRTAAPPGPPGWRLRNAEQLRAWAEQLDTSASTATPHRAQLYRRRAVDFRVAAAKLEEQAGAQPG